MSLGRPLACLGATALLAASAACSPVSERSRTDELDGAAEPASPAPPVELRAPRGVVLISIDALRADRLGPYGADRPTTPFLDRLADRAVVFENAFCPIPSTLPSHLSMLTGLYPSEHGVLPPADVLPSEIPTLAERLRAAGVRTFGHTEGGYVQGGYGFARGFEEWTDTAYERDTDVERTFARGLASLARVGATERFFLFLHSYTVHDPYDPPAEHRARFWPGAPPAGAFDPTGPEFAAFNRGTAALAPGALDWYRALYDGGVRYLDDVLAEFFVVLERDALARDTLVVLTSDHGEEFAEHGRLAHSQVYPECLRVPLIVVHPDRRAPHRPRVVTENVDLAPTILELLGLAVPPELRGTSRVPELAGGGERVVGRAFGEDEMYEVRSRTVVLPVGGRLHQLVRSETVGESDGFWLAHELEFDARSPELELRAAAFHRPRTVIAWVDGRERARLEIGLDWAAHRLALPPGGKHVVRLRSDGCESPEQVGLSGDRRCLAVKLAGHALDRTALFDLERDPGAATDLSLERPDLVRTLGLALRQYPTHAIATASRQRLSATQIEHLRALGYL